MNVNPVPNDKVLVDNLVAFSELLTIVFDLDGVVVDARHRQAVLPDGSLDLEKYKANATYDNVLKDAALPAIQAMQELTRQGKEFYVCTARPACMGTLVWLAKNGCSPSKIFARGVKDDRPDYKLKHQKLTDYFTPEKRRDMVLVDDNVKNCEMALSIGMGAINVKFEGH